MCPSLDKNYWLSRYQQNQIGWSAGEATIPLKQYLDQLHDYGVEIFLRDTGNTHKATYAFQERIPACACTGYRRRTTP
ncbi:hypothetical protein [Echinicola rosea]|uniref:hypothetical protein n=1 Tax=Echinicola rosea TaxID=1807691 RepID=UPI0010CA8EEB|nr:hypothetical protein [Echinicola rosea]